MSTASNPPHSHAASRTQSPGLTGSTETAGEAIARRRELARLIPLWPSELADLSIEGRARLIGKLERALRAERRRGLAGHFAYDLSRHAQLVRCTRAEAAALKALVADRAAQGLR